MNMEELSEVQGRPWDDVDVSYIVSSARICKLMGLQH